MMKFCFALPGLMLLVFTACSGTTGHQQSVDTSANAIPTAEEAVTDGKLIAQVFCQNNPSQSYALYIPAGGMNRTLPIIYFFDPHAAGALPLEKYKALAEQHQFILVGSNNARNGNDWPTTDNIWQSLQADTRSKLHIDTNQVYTCGFSGGAKTAGYVALKYPGIKGVIAGGAALPDGTPAANFPFSYTILAGEGDLNLTDLIATNKDLDKTNTRHRIAFFNGKHEWAPEATMGLAFAGLTFDAMRNKSIPKNDSLIAGYIATSKKNIDNYINANDAVHAELECTLAANMLEGLSGEVDWFKQKDASIKAGAVFQQQSKARQALLQQEENTKTVYMQMFQQGDMQYWQTTIHDLQIKSKAATAEAAMNQRLLAYLSLSFYSITNHFVKASEASQAEYFDSLYKLADATNSEAWYFSAILNARKNNIAGAKADLEKAVDLGFNDKMRIQQQVEFQVIANEINLQEIMASIK